MVNVGEKDLMMGIQFLSEVGQKARFSFISSNLVDKKSQKEVFKPSVIKEIAGMKIGILGLVDDQFTQTLQGRDSTLTLLDPFSTGKALSASLREHCDLIIVLSQLGESKNRRFARENPQVDLILGGGESQKAVMERVNEIPIYRLEPRGGYLGRVDFSIVEAKRPIRFTISSERDEMEKRLKRLTTRLMQIKSEMAKPGKQDEMKRKELKFLEAKQKDLDKSLSTFEEKNSYRHLAIPVQLTVQDDPRILKRVEAYRAESAKLFGVKESPALGERLSEKEIAARILKESAFVGAVSCKKCHEANYRNWLKTKHADASQTIARSPKYAQEECLVCHSTGFGKISEFATVEEIPISLRGVQCEACHGEGKGHPEKGGIVRQVTLGICRNCHTRDQSPAFDYKSYREKVGCKVTK